MVGLVAVMGISVTPFIGELAGGFARFMGDWGVSFGSFMAEWGTNFGDFMANWGKNFGYFIRNSMRSMATLAVLVGLLVIGMSLTSRSS